MLIRKQRRTAIIRTAVIGEFSLMLAACAGGMNGMADADSGQCWSMKGGVGVLKKNSSTQEECKELGGKSWCPVGGGCINL